MESMTDDFNGKLKELCKAPKFLWVPNNTSVCRTIVIEIKNKMKFESKTNTRSL